MAARDAGPHYKKEAKKRQREHGHTAPGKKAETLTAEMQEVKGEAIEHAAADFAVSPRLVYDAKAIQEKAPEKASILNCVHG